MDYKLNRAWAEVNLDNIAHNVKEIKRVVGKRTEIMAVVKADAYGHGSIETAATLIENGANRLAVSMIDEAIQLRESGINVPILLLNHTDPIRFEEIIKYELTQTVFSHELAEALSDTAVRLNKKINIHIKIDTGMSRVGFLPGYSAVKDVIRISKLPGIIIEGLFTHFASADETDKTYTYSQYEKFESICNELNRIGLYIPIKHVANSAAIIQFPEMHLNMVRPGIILYGLYPSQEVDKKVLDLRPAMELKAKVILVKDLEEGIPISYGRIYTTSTKTRVATIPIGYADGYLRSLSNKGRMLINGEYAKVLGRICMDQCVVDVSNFNSKVEVGDEVVLIGNQREKSIHIDEIAKFQGTINYETVCLIGKRIPRAYIKNGDIINVINYLI